ncbi:cell division protein FtsQ/DivIB [Yoonia sp. 208BN28-4]|uniref:cell division protein FtsQ/DivIB n=1 Tax=Yoonia sp. 208BN28-4 TaxID=3126505 RepID=UPI0030B532ED
MRSLMGQRRARNFRDPAPSKWGYRYQRLMLTPGFRGAVRIGVPLALIAIIGTTWLSRDSNREMVTAKIADIKASLQQRPEFMITEMKVTGGDLQIATDVATVLPLEFPLSSFDLDMEAVRNTVEDLYAVESARVRVGEGGALDINVTPRVPVAIWRDGETLRLIDADGVFSGIIDTRAVRRDLPLIAGDGAEQHINEALVLFTTARPVGDRVRGLVRMGERRWDMVMDRGQRILLPENAPIAALDRVIALQQAQDLLARDVATIDMRNANRPTIKMTDAAANALRRVSDTGE